MANSPNVCSRYHALWEVFKSYTADQPQEVSLGLHVQKNHLPKRSILPTLLQRFQFSETRWTSEITPLCLCKSLAPVMLTHLTQGPPTEKYSSKHSKTAWPNLLNSFANIKKKKTRKTRDDDNQMAWQYSVQHRELWSETLSH